MTLDDKDITILWLNNLYTDKFSLRKGKIILHLRTPTDDEFLELTNAQTLDLLVCRCRWLTPTGSFEAFVSRLIVEAREEVETHEDAK